MKKRVLFLLGSVFIMTFPQTISLEPLNKKIIENIYGPRGLAISQTEQKKIETLLHDIAVSTRCQRYFTIDLIVPQLQALLEKDAHDTRTHFKNFILEHQIDYLIKYKNRLAKNLTFYERLELKFEKIFKKLGCYIKKMRNTAVCWEELLADRIIDYVNFERENILFNYQNLLSFNVLINKHKTHTLPEILNFWSNRLVQAELVTRSRSITPNVSMQFLSELFMLALQSFLMGGNGMYIQWLDEEDQKIFEEYQAEQGKIETSFQVYVQHLNKVKQNLVAQIFKGFKAGLQNIYDTTKKANDAAVQEQLYLFKSINLSDPAIHLLSWPPIPYDQMFEVSLMNTPKRQPWYNIYQEGDWEFDEKTNSFFQNELVSFGLPFWQKDFMKLKKPGDTAEGYPTDPSRNSIFTEYISNESSYDVSIECTLLNCSYPFFVGILFNRGRWISADPERLWQYRLVGLYGTQSDDKDPSTRSIALGFAQQVITFEKDKEQIFSPLEQITRAKPTDDHVLFYSLPKKDVQLLVKDSMKFTFDITTSPESVSVTVIKDKEQIVQKTFNNLGSTIALYGGIGFMAPGAQAEFKIIKPEKLVFSSTDLGSKQ